MKQIIKTLKEVDIKLLKLEVAVRYGEEDIPNDFPMRSSDMWKATIDLDTKKIVDWPQGKTGSFDMKICDQGSYYLLDADGNTVASIEQDYVPNALLPGEYGDYLEMEINEEGLITNWKANADFSNFPGFDTED